MENPKSYDYSEQQRSFIETSVIPFAFFRVENKKVKTVLVSDGLCRLMNENRENAMKLLEGDIYHSVHQEDVYELRRKCRNFFFGSGEVSTSVRVRYNNEKNYHYIYLSGKKIVSDQNEHLCILWYNNIDIGTYSPEYEEKRKIFENFLHGESNDIPFHTFGYKGYTIWNITSDELVFQSGVGIAGETLGHTFPYRDYYALHKGWLTEKDDIDFFERISPDKMAANSVNTDFGYHIFTFSSNEGQISIKIAASSMMSPDGELYLKLQAENVTDSIVYDSMIKSSAMVSDFMAYIDSENVYFMEGEHKVKVPLVQMLEMFSVNFGYRFKNIAQLMNFIEFKCGTNSSATIINRISPDHVESIRLQRIDKDEKKYFICGSDVTELLKLEINSSFDDLTGLPNMTQFRIIAQSYITKTRNQNKTPVLIYFDIRDMKAINEKYGFESGNSVLINTMYVLKNTFAGEPVSRLSEDRFVVLTVRRSVEQSIEKVYDQVMNNPMNIPVQICAGLYIDDGRDIDIDSLCDRARLACRSIKEDYNKKYKLFDNTMFEEYHKRRYILTHFDEALEKGYISVHYQPIVRSLTGNICDFEALCRWTKPDRGMAQPFQFIPVLEEHRLIHKLDFYMVKKICEDLDRLRNMNFPLVPISVNLSRIDFEMFDVADEVIKIVDSYRIPHKLLSIEITESAFIHNADFLNGQINKFHSAGFEVWMDDFGSDFSSFKTLQKYNFDVVKLDMEFLKDFGTTNKSAIIITEVVNMLTKLGIHTLAEGVDTDEKKKFLRDIGCEKMQGHSFKKAMPLDYHISQYQRKVGLDYDDFTTVSYYNQIGAVRLDESILKKNHIRLSDSALSLPVAVIEYRQDNFRILRANDEYKRFVEKIGLGEQCENNEYSVWKKQPSKEFRLAAKKCLVTYTNQAIFDDIEGNYLVSARLICISYKYSLDMGAFAVVVEKYRKIGDAK